MTDKERCCFADRLNPQGNLELYANKWKAYETYKEYYKRQLCVIDKNDSNAFKVFSEFFKVHSCGLAKRIDGSGGHGISLIKNVSDPKSSFKKALREIGDRFVLEEMIVQSEDLANVHPESVNTVRVPAIRYDDRVRILPPVFRCGRGNAFVDNASSGGIICGINPETGIIISAADERGNIFYEHPDTAAKLLGLHMPEWEELLQTAKEVTLKVPTNRYYSWDFAHADTGWILVEGNFKGQFLWQIPSQKGFRKEANEILKYFGKDLL